MLKEITQLAEQNFLLEILEWNDLLRMQLQLNSVIIQAERRDDLLD